ncbi:MULTISPECIES: transposase family protein [unclassified Streptomyces]|uniref:transposase family protein n=1 Tax=unclassified Streptomyces TaxID=2593676 RepID=UPI00332BA99E
MSVESVDVTDAVVGVEARSTARRAACPGCGCWSSRIHGSYLRFPRDLPASGRLVVMSLRVRRFVCAEGSCLRKTFAEQVSGLTRRFARRTERLRSTLVSVGLAESDMQRGSRERHESTLAPVPIRTRVEVGSRGPGTTKPRPHPRTIEAGRSARSARRATELPQPPSRRRPQGAPPRSPVGTLRAHLLKRRSN